MGKQEVRMMKSSLLFLAAGAVVMALMTHRLLRKEIRIPAHMLGQRVFYQRDLLSHETAGKLMNLTKDMADFPTNLRDLKFYHTLHEHIGEAVPLPADGLCESPFMVPSLDRTQCVLAGRIDVGRHWILTGGPSALRANYDSMVSRVQSFGRYNFGLKEYPLAEELFRDPKFLQAATEVCPTDKPHLDPFQFNFIIQIPGQTVATHIDGAYFWGATRFQFPQWLLAAMTFSGLWKDRFVDQVQVVAYYHEWDPAILTGNGVDAGEFLYWNDP